MVLDAWECTMNQQLESVRISPSLGWQMPSPVVIDDGSAARRHEVVIDELEFRCLKTAREISEAHRLRAAIQLPASAVGAADFATREKKETWKASCARSIGATLRSAPCASFRCEGG